MDTNNSIASAIERGITAQSSLITSLSLAVIGYFITVYVQVKLHNSDTSKTQIVSKGTAFLVISIVDFLVNILIGYMLSGAIISVAPKLYGFHFDINLPFAEQKIADPQYDMLRFLSVGQFAMF